MTSLQKRLFQLQDTKYRDFHSKLIPNIDKERVIGIRIPMLRQFAKEFGKKNGGRRLFGGAAARLL